MKPYIRIIVYEDDEVPSDRELAGKKKTGFPGSSDPIYIVNYAIRRGSDGTYRDDRGFNESEERGLSLPITNGYFPSVLSLFMISRRP